ncbi:MAG: hypothetical protein QW579_03260 [Desulfurococcaceae archaeon]
MPHECNSTLRKALSALVEWFKEHGARFPWRGEIGWYGILVAETMLIRTRRTVAERVFIEFMEKYPTPESLCKADSVEVEALFRKIGLPWRARKLRETVCLILSEYRGVLPCSYSELVELPGVGEYIARVLLARVCKKHYAFVDSNVSRVFSRLVGLDLDVKAIERILEACAEPGELIMVNTALLDVGDLYCKPREPVCTLCPLKETCSHGSQIREASSSRAEANLPLNA